MTLGFRSPTGDHLPNRVNVERSPRGIARGLSTLGCAIDPSRPGSPDRTWPAVRRVPPRIALDGTGVDPDRIDAPDDSRARTVGWDAPNRPLGAFDVCGATPPPRRLDDSPLDVTVVRCSLLYVADDVIEQYRARESDLPLHVTEVTDPSADRLREVIAADTDLLHIVAHGHEYGVECADDDLTVGDATECGAETVMLNACESYKLGERLLESGAAAVAVTTGVVPDGTAATVGADWAGLMSLGWTVERALDFARSVVDPGAYIALGDGTHVVTRPDGPIPPLVTADNESITIDNIAPREAGSRVINTLTSDPHLPTQHIYSTELEQVQRVAETHDSPVRESGELVWNWSLE